KACKISGVCKTLQAPSAAITMNQQTITGPKNLPIFSVPCCCTRNKQTKIAIQAGTTYLASWGCNTSTPSTALKTEIAGVIMLSPSSNAAPNKPSGSNQTLLFAFDRLEHTSVVSARMPPSPSKSARKITIKYLIETIMTNAQIISEITPTTLAA